MKNHDKFLDERELLHLLLKEVKEIKARMPANKKVDLGILDVADVLQNLKISPKTLRTWTHKGLLRSAKIEGRVYYKADDIKALFQEHFNRK